MRFDVSELLESVAPRIDTLFSKCHAALIIPLFIRFPREEPFRPEREFASEIDQSFVTADLDLNARGLRW